MLEIPEARTLAEQIRESLTGRRIAHVTAAASAHKFAWFSGDPAAYPALLEGAVIDGAAAYGGLLEVTAGDRRMLFGDGVNLRRLSAGTKPPVRHQLLLALDDGSHLVAGVQMYGGIWAYLAGGNDNPYYRVAQEKPNPLDDAFDAAYFAALFTPEADKLSAKAFLATKQRIPGLGNGVLQDILFTARIHPKRRIAGLPDRERAALFRSVKETLARMTEARGRDTEKDLFGTPGGYRTLAGRRAAGEPCPVCGAPIEKETYLGGSIHYCALCQPCDTGKERRG